MSEHDLIERIEAAIEPSRLLDTAIYKATTKELTPEQYVEAFRKEHGREPSPSLKKFLEHCRDAAEATPPRYTSSIDTALTLLPDGMVWNLLTDYGDLCRARVYNGRQMWEADGATPALAVCAAMLKARADSRTAP